MRGLIVACGLGFFASSANAQIEMSSMSLASSTSTESERTGMMELKFGGYIPRIDSEKGLNGATPYASAFGANAVMLLAELEIDRELWQGFGTVSAGFSAGYAEKFGSATFADGTLANQRTAFFVVPLHAMAIYRADFLAQLYHFPLIPYAKLALIYMPWWSTKGGSIEISNGVRAQGAKWGYGLIGGVSFLLDVLEPRLAKDFDADIGVNHTYLFAEFNYANVNNFGAAGLDLSSRHLMFGLAFEF